MPDDGNTSELRAPERIPTPDRIARTLTAFAAEPGLLEVGYQRYLVPTRIVVDLDEDHVSPRLPGLLARMLGDMQQFFLAYRVREHAAAPTPPSAWRYAEVLTFAPGSTTSEDDEQIYPLDETHPERSIEELRHLLAREIYAAEEAPGGTDDWFEVNALMPPRYTE